jgi:dimethylamine monooxygenase subunit A
MAHAFKKETFRDDYTYRNSPEAIRRFPFPFAEDRYMYSVNMEPHTSGAPGSVVEHTVDVDEHYVAECMDKAITLSKDPGRYAALPHTMDAQWDTLELIMDAMSRDYPDQFKLTKNGNEWSWENKPLGIKDTFTFGDRSTLPMEPFEYIGRQSQGDWVILDQRDNDLYADAGIVTSQADWSLMFDAGMSFMQWHGPVPQAHEMGVFERALKYLLNMQYGSPVRRLNWTMTINPRLDTSPENYEQWGHERNTVTPQNAGEKVHLRVELQTLYRLPRSNGIVFGIRCYLISLEELATYPRWAKRMHRILKGLHPDLVEYKGLTKYRESAIQWLSRYDDGAPLELGTQPE